MLAAQLADQTILDRHGRDTPGSEALDAIADNLSPCHWTCSLEAGTTLEAISQPYRTTTGQTLVLTLLDYEILTTDTFAAQFSLEALRQLDRMADRVATQHAICLGEREGDCLTWAARGKTASEIAMILGLSVHTVNQYLAQAQLRLGASNRTQAVARAISVGLIPRDPV